MAGKYSRVLELDNKQHPHNNVVLTLIYIISSNYYAIFKTS